jgi:hypothetical protein
MLWLRFPPSVNVPWFIEQAGKELESLADLSQEDAGSSVLVHVVYSTDQPPRAVIHDPTDSVFFPVNVSGLSVSVPYLLPRGLISEMVSAMEPISQPGGVTRKPKNPPESS